MNAKYQQWLYLNKVEEVRQRVAADNYYDLVMATGLVRHLLLEQFALADKANRHLPNREKLKFEVLRGKIGRASPVPIALGIHRIEPFPDEPPDSPIKTKIISRDELLSTCVIISQGKEITVKDVLEAYTYARGGVHLNDTPNETEQALLDLDASILYLGQPPSVKFLKEIINVILAGLRPLTDAVKAEFEAEE
jgi:hypothetical protein